MGRPKTIRASREVIDIDQLAHPPSIPEMIGWAATLSLRATHVAVQLGTQTLVDFAHDTRERVTGLTDQVAQVSRAVLHLN